MTSRLAQRLTPLFDRVLVTKFVPKKEIGGIILPEKAQDKSNTGKVVAVGKGKRTNDGKYLPISVSVGDTVLLSEYGGSEIKIDNEEYLVVKEDDILGIISEEKS
eukprot:TRINITY_DN805_c0_g1_i1.p1 TRINITY_DN805_c0_g1~~TRINITY_DN805_c0_g1_i1.p1  ORF type:complete len:105 (-),score=30.23 TRINITY_DN805_c0_g1_i1:56-370(-)